MEGTMEREDSDIIKDIRAGKEAAMEELVRKYQKRVFNTAYGLCMNYDTAWDVSQEALVKAVRYVTTFRGESSFWTFLYRITMNAFYDIKRKEKVRSRVSNFTDVSVGDDGEERAFDVKDMFSIEEDFDRKMARERIAKGLESLTDIQKEVFVMKNSEGLKIREIASVLKLSEGTIKSHLSRAMEKLKASLGGV